MTRTPGRWVRVAADPQDPTQPDPANLTIDEGLGCLLWIGPEGDGHCWHTDLTRPLQGVDAVGVVWTSDLGEVRRAPDDLSRWWPSPGPWLMALEPWALSEGYAYAPPPFIDSDGDGVADDQDADPYDPAVQ